MLVSIPYMDCMGHDFARQQAGFEIGSSTGFGSLGRLLGGAAMRPIKPGLQQLGNVTADDFGSQPSTEHY